MTDRGPRFAARDSPERVQVREREVVPYETESERGRLRKLEALGAG